MKKTVYLAFALLIMLNGCTPNVNEDSTEASISTEAPTVFTPTHIETTETVDEVVFDPMELVKDMTDEELVSIIDCPYNIYPVEDCKNPTCWPCKMEWLKEEASSLTQKEKL